MVVKRVGTSVDGLLVHVGRATTDGFQTLDVWESKEHFDRANTEIVFPLMRSREDQPLPSIEQGNGSLRRTRPCHPRQRHPRLADRDRRAALRSGGLPPEPGCIWRCRSGEQAREAGKGWELRRPAQPPIPSW